MGIRAAPVSTAARVGRAASGLSTAAVAVVAVLALGGLSVLYLVQTSQVVRLGYELTHLQEQHDQIVLETSRLRYEIARYQSLPTVEQVARHELGMVPVRRTVFLDLERPAQPAPAVATETTVASVSWEQRLWELIWGVGRAADGSEGTARDRQGGQ
jgi:cell division protein FtsL